MGKGKKIVKGIQVTNVKYGSGIGKKTIFEIK
jgi:hypothetical protein